LRARADLGGLCEWHVLKGPIDSSHSLVFFRQFTWKKIALGIFGLGKREVIITRKMAVGVYPQKRKG